MLKSVYKQKGAEFRNKKLILGGKKKKRDSFKQQATEIFILQMTAKNLLFYAFSTFVNTWVATDGPAKVFEVYGVVSLCIVATCIPMCKSILAPPLKT